MNRRGVYTTERFLVEMKGVTEGSFSECSGLQVETEIFEWEEGGLNEYKHRLPGRIKYVNLVLKRGVATGDLWDWFSSCMQGKVKRHDLSLVLCGYDGLPGVRWDIRDAFPVKWVGPTFKSSASEAAVETLELAHHGLKRV